MNFINSFKIRQVLAVSIAIVLSISLVSGMINYNEMEDVIEKSDKQRKEILPNLMDFLELKLNVIQIQQWLTDVSATRATKGFDDGYKEAEDYFKKANITVDRLIAMHTSLGEDEMVESLKKYKEDLKKYYAVGVEMADAYVKSGPEEGNKFMKKLDPFAEKLAIQLNKWVTEHKAESARASEDVGESIANFKIKSILLSVLLFVVITLAFYIIDKILKQISKIDVYLEQLAELNFTANEDKLCYLYYDTGYSDDDPF